MHPIYKPIDRQHGRLHVCFWSGGLPPYGALLYVVVVRAKTGFVAPPTPALIAIRDCGYASVKWSIPRSSVEPAAVCWWCCVLKLINNETPLSATMAARVTALVTGGASGLGRATALCLARRGMGVVVADVRNETPFEHENIRYAETDVSSELQNPLSALYNSSSKDKDTFLGGTSLFWLHP